MSIIYLCPLVEPDISQLEYIVYAIVSLSLFKLFKVLLILQPLGKKLPLKVILSIYFYIWILGVVLVDGIWLVLYTT